MHRTMVDAELDRLVEQGILTMQFAKWADPITPV